MIKLLINPDHRSMQQHEFDFYTIKECIKSLDARLNEFKGQVFFDYAHLQNPIKSLHIAIDKIGTKKLNVNS